LSFSLEPARLHGAASGDPEYVINADGGGGNGQVLEMRQVDNAGECCDGQDGDYPTLDQWSDLVGSYSAPPTSGAKQKGSSVGIDGGDSRLLYAVVEAATGTLVTGQNTACYILDTCAVFTELFLFPPPAFVPPVNDWISGSVGVDDYYPAVDGNDAGYRTMVFTRSSFTSYAKTKVVGIPPWWVCTQCTDGPSTTLRNGSNTYVNVDSSGRNRWGDFLGA